MLVSIGQAAQILGVCEKTLRRWDAAGILIPSRTPGNHRRYDLTALQTFRETRDYSPPRTTHTHKAAIYARVSAAKQKEDLERQISYLCQIAERDGYTPIVFADIGSGLNDNRPSFRKLLRHAFKHQFDCLYVTYLDRLARFGTRPVLDMLEMLGKPLHVVNIPEDVSFHETLMLDMMALIYSFSGKLYRSRRGQNSVG